ncbi:hypothetical protein ALC57_07964 [Trachymyrmex cornetzi]|uniref:Uncharacterized protein n=1 Tax=Trachymyrmex cornetzi TaxID=471704 RepID=A0A151J7U1_9HYME|nr:hypothetical protein ALC57_07964 [Trachymyrmex cornetzi]
MGHQRAAPQLAPCTITEPIVISDMDDVEFENIGNIEDIDGVEFDENIGNGEDMGDVVFENIRNMNEEQLDEVFNEMDVDFENILDQESSDEELLSDDTGCDSDLSECEMDVVEKFISVAKIRTLNPRTKVCISYDYFTTGGALALCTECMFNIADIIDAGMLYIYRKHEIGSFGRLSSRSCTNCRSPLYKIVLCCMNVSSESTKPVLPIHEVSTSARYAKRRCTLHFHAACAHSAHIEKLFSAPCKSASASCKSALTCFALLQRCDECIEQLEEPCRTKRDKRDKHVNVLYLQDPRNDGVGHFAWIKDLSRLVRSQLTRKEHKKYFCDRTSLEKLASYLDKNKLQIVRSEFTTLSDEEFELLTRKGIFPYEYIDCVDKLQDTRLPSR